MNVKISWRIGRALSVAAIIGAVAALSGYAAEEKLTIKQVMVEGHKGDGALYKKVESGKSTKEENERLVEIYKALAADEPPKGDKASWDAKTAAMVKAAQEVVDGDAKGLADLKVAADCKACHSVHKKS